MDQPTDPNRDMTPSMQIGAPPRFFELDEYVFQDLCAALLGKESGVYFSEVYGERGQKQDGIDIWAWRAEDRGTVTEVGQCKRYQDFEPQDIRNASDEFFAHWETRWKDAKVKRFILFVASEFRTAERIRTLGEQRQRFEEKGIRYEPWSARTIRDKLRPYPEIIRTYVKEDTETWVRKICGEALALPAAVSAESADNQTGHVSVLTQQVDVLEARLADDIEQHYEQARTALREGHPEVAKALIRRTRDDTATWGALTPRQKAQLLGLEAILEMGKPGGLQRAEDLVNQAQELVPGENLARLRALLAYHQVGPAAALPLLDSQTELANVNLRAALLLDDHQVDASLDLINTVMPAPEDAASLKPEHAESLRVQALGFLANRQIDQARLSIGKAQELAPTWVGVRFAAATINYFSALTPAVLPGFLVAWPSPTEWDFVQRDDSSLGRLRSAAATFHSLLQENALADEGDIGSLIPIWYLACLANDPEQQEAAIANCRSLLEANPTNYAAVLWAIARHFDIDLAPSASAIAGLVNDGKASIVHVTSLFHYLLADGKPDDAAKLLEDQRALYERSDPDGLAGWKSLYNLALVAQGDLDEAERVLNEQSDGAVVRRARATILDRRGRETGDWKPLLDHLDAGYRATGDVTYLLDACRLHAYNSNWAYIAENADDLITCLPTVAALRLVATATYERGQYSRCLGFLEEYQRLFPHSQLPTDLRLGRAICQRKLGIISKAIAEAEAVAESEPTNNNLLALANLYFEKGDIWALGRVARRLLSHENLAIRDALRLCDQVKLDNRDLAIELWRYAVRQGIEDELVGLAFNLGTFLGLEREVGPLAMRMTTLAQEGKAGLQAIEIKGLLEMMDSRHKYVSELASHYWAAKLPIHTVAAELNWWLPLLYHKILRDNATRPDPARQPVTMTRYGGHPFAAGVLPQRPQDRLIADVTSLLLAAHLEILDAAERVFAPIYIADTVVQALMQMRGQLTPHQRSRPEEFRAVLDLANTGALREMSAEPSAEAIEALRAEYPQFADDLGEERLAVLATARSENGYMVDYLPLHGRTLDRPQIEISAGLQNGIINIRTVLDALRQHGPLAGTEYVQALEVLGTEGRAEPAGAIPPPRSKLFLNGEIARSLAGADVLRHLCTQFQVFVEPGDLATARMVVEYTYGEGRQLTDWVSVLQERINSGLDGEHPKYAWLPSYVPTDDNKHLPDDPTDASLITLLTTPAGPNDLVWADDRTISSYLLLGAAPIITSSELLKILLDAGAISQETYYRKLHQLRAGNARFLPVQPEEMVYHLLQAQIKDGRAVPTEALQVLRSYVAACILPGPAGLQRIDRNTHQPENRNPTAEMPFLSQLRAGVGQAIRQLWCSGDTENAAIRSKWLLDNLYVEPLDPYPQEDNPLTPEAETYASALTISNLFLQTLPMLVELEGRGDEIARQYSDWLWKQVIEPRSTSDAYLVPAVAEALKHSTFALLQGLVPIPDRKARERDKAIGLRRRLLTAFYLKLPAALKREWDQDPQIMANTDLVNRSVTKVDDISFETVAFNRAAAKALSGKSTAIPTLEPKTNLKFHPYRRSDGGTEGGNGVKGKIEGLWFEHPVTKQRVNIDATHTGLGIVRGSVSDREAWLQQRREWFDTSESEYVQVVAEVAAETDPARRVKAVDEWLEANLAFFYKDLESKLNRREPLRTVDLVSLSASGLVRHLRLPINVPAGEGFAAALDQAAHLLLKECGAQEALERLCGLPVPIPQNILDALAGLSSSERRELVHHILRTAPSPVVAIHLLRILLAFRQDSPAYERLARWIVRRLSSEEGTKEFGAFLRLLRWVEVSSESWQGRATLSPCLNLALVWAHTQRLFAILGTCGVSLDWVPAEHESTRHRNPANLFARQDEYSRDVANPFRVSHGPFLLSALAYGVGDSANVILDDALRDQVVEATYLQVGDLKYPSLDLMRETSAAANGLVSFLGDNVVEQYAKVAGKDAIVVLNPEKLRESIVGSIVSLKEAPTDARDWAALDSVLGDLPPSSPVADALKDLIMQTSFQELFAAGLTCGIVAMQTSTRAASHLDSKPLLEHLESELLAITSFLATGAENRPAEREATNPSTRGEPPDQDNDTVVTNEELGSYLMEWGYFLAQAAGDGQVIATKFANLLGELVNRWPFLTRNYTKSASNLIWTLPLDLAKPFWSLLVRLRTEKLD